MSSYSIPPIAAAGVGGNYTVKVGTTEPEENLLSILPLLDTRSKAVFERLDVLERRLAPVLRAPSPTGEGKPQATAAGSELRNQILAHSDGLRAMENLLCGILARLDLP